jgi:hypothetical protein
MGRSPCCEKAHTNKGAWTKEEDDRLTAYIKAHGEGCWRSLPKAAGLLRCGKSCRLRWINYLRPDLKRGNFSEEEDELIIKLHSLLGNKYVHMFMILSLCLELHACLYVYSLVLNGCYSCLMTQMVADRREAAGEDGQRDQELLEHAHQEEADEQGDRPGDAPGDQRAVARVQHNHLIRGGGDGG